MSDLLHTQYENRRLITIGSDKVNRWDHKAQWRISPVGEVVDMKALGQRHGRLDMYDTTVIIKDVPHR